MVLVEQIPLEELLVACEGISPSSFPTTLFLLLVFLILIFLLFLFFLLFFFLIFIFYVLSESDTFSGIIIILLVLIFVRIVPRTAS